MGMKWIMTNAGGRGDAEGRVSGKWKWRISFWAVPSSPLQWLPFLLFIYDLAMSCLFCHSFLTSASSTSKLPLFWSCVDFMHCCSRDRKVGSSDGVLADIVTLASFLPSSLSLPPSQCWGIHQDHVNAWQCSTTRSQSQSFSFSS